MQRLFDRLPGLGIPQRLRAAVVLIPALAFVMVICGWLVMDRVTRRKRDRRDHKDASDGDRNTILEEVVQAMFRDLARLVWGTMKDNTAKAFQEGHPGRVLLAHLAALQPPLPRVVLVGQSAGSIYICNLLQNARTLVPNQRFDLILTAPAVTAGRFAETLEQCAASIGQVRVFSLKEQTERRDRMIGALPDLYQSSLLYFISGGLEPTDGVSDGYMGYQGDTAILGLQRFTNSQSGSHEYLPQQFLLWEVNHLPPRGK